MALLLVLVAMSIMTSLVAPEVKAQDIDGGGWFQPREKKEKEPKEDLGPRTIQFKTDFALDYRRSIVSGVGINFRGSEGIPPINFIFSFAFPNTSFGVKMISYPFRTIKWLGVGVESTYFYSSNIDLYSEFFFGGKVKNTFGSPKTKWDHKRFVVAPAVEFFIPSWRRSKFGLRMNPLLFGFWDYSNGDWGNVKRWYNLTVFWTVDLGKKVE